MAKKDRSLGAVEVLPIEVKDVTNTVYPKGIPKNPDGSIALDGDIPVEQAQEIGALDEESAAKNRSNAKSVHRKLRGETNVKWNSKEYQDLFHGLQAAYNPASIQIYIRQISPEEIDYEPFAMSGMRTALELHKHIRQKIHRNKSKATYKISFREQGSQRAVCMITMDDAVAEDLDKEDDMATKAQQPASPYPGYTWNGSQWVPAAPPWVGPPPQGPPPGYYPQQQYYPPPQGVYGPPAAQAAPAPVPVATTKDASPPAPAPAPAVVPPPAPHQPGYDANAYMHWLNAQNQEIRQELRSYVQQSSLQMERLLGALENRLQAPVQTPPQAQYYPAPPGYLGGPPLYSPQPAPAPAPAPAPVVAAPPPPPQPSPAQQMREMVSTVSSIAQVAQDLNSVFKKMAPQQPPPGYEEIPEEPAPPPQEEMPVKIVQMGIGDKQVPVAMDPAGNVQLGMTLIPLIPSAFEAAKNAFDGIMKIQTRQHEHEQSLWRRKVELATAQRGGSALPPAPPPEAQPAPEPQTSVPSGLSEVWRPAPS